MEAGVQLKELFIDLWASIEMVWETQTCKHIKVVIYINLCTNEGMHWSRTHMKMILMGQPKHEPTSTLYLAIWDFLAFWQICIYIKT